MTFHAFLQTKYPLYSDNDIKVNLTVKQLLELVEEFISETSPVFEVKVVDADDFQEEYFEDDDFEEVYGNSEAENCHCGAYKFLNGRWLHISDCCC